MIYDQYYRHPQLEEVRAKYRLNYGDNTVNMQEMYGYFEVSNPRFDVFPSKWGKDYLTSCLPTPQMGDAVKIPTMHLNSDGTYEPQRVLLADGTAGAGTTDLWSSDGELANATSTKVVLEGSSTVRDLSVASVLQTLKEQLMKVGQRYKDWIDYAFDEDVDPLDINVPLMIGSYKGTVVISDVLTQANTTIGESEFGTGDYTGNAGLYEANMGSFRFNCRDYGILMAIITVTPTTGYGQGINRYWRYASPLDYPMDIFSTIGDQEVLKEEAFYNNVTSEASKNLETFGYIPRFSEASFMNNNYGTNLLWGMGLSTHMGKWYDPDEIKGSLYDDYIEINRNFLRADDSIGGSRVGQVFRSLTLTSGTASQTPIIAYLYHNIKVMRCLPTYSTPSLGA